MRTSSPFTHRRSIFSMASPGVGHAPSLQDRGARATWLRAGNTGTVGTLHCTVHCWKSSRHRRGTRLLLQLSVLHLALAELQGVHIASRHTKTSLRLKDGQCGSPEVVLRPRLPRYGDLETMHVAATDLLQAEPAPSSALATFSPTHHHNECEPAVLLEHSQMSS